MFFPVSNIEIPLWLPPVAAFIISFFTSMGGISGAIFLLPFQVSVLGITAPNVSATNFAFNIFAIPGGVYRYFKEGRICLPILWVILAGTIPGLFIGTYMRQTVFLEQNTFKLFCGFVLLLVALRMVSELLRYELQKKSEVSIKKLNHQIPLHSKINILEFNWLTIRLEFEGKTYKISSIKLFFICCIVGVVGGAYGIGGGAIISPFLVSLFGLPIYIVAGVSLIGTFITSIFGVTLYSYMSMSADWLLGFLFGIGGFLGIYLGALCQRFVPQNPIKILLVIILLFLGIRYILLYFLR
ncbi:MAG: hypothetical protein HW421_3127 [Ignavibacteria bacterium]|nr:hypothetical protein [Ignavibacteria bacterium]